MKATALLALQHHRIRKLIERLSGVASVVDINGRQVRVDWRERELVLVELIDEIQLHIAIDEELFYPAAHRVMDLSLRRHRELHRRARAALVHLATFGADGHRFQETLSELEAAFREHVALEERELMAAAERLIGDRELERLATQVNARMIARSAELARASGGPFEACDVAE